VTIILQNKAKVDVQDSKGKTALMLACGYCEIVKALIDNISNVNLKDKSGSTALMWACEGGYAQSVKLLLENNVDVDIQNEDGKTALMVARRKGQIACSKRLLNNTSLLVVHVSFPNIAPYDTRLKLLHDNCMLPDMFGYAISLHRAKLIAACSCEDTETNSCDLLSTSSSFQTEGSKRCHSLHCDTAIAQKDFLVLDLDSCEFHHNTNMECSICLQSFHIDEDVAWSLRQNYY